MSLLFLNSLCFVLRILVICYPVIKTSESMTLSGTMVKLEFRDIIIGSFRQQMTTYEGNSRHCVFG